MKRHLSTILIAVVCSIVSALATFFVVEHHYQNVVFMFLQGRPGDYLMTAARIREGKSEELIKMLEWNAQVEFLRHQHYAKNKQWTFDFSYQVLDAYKKKYHMHMADPLQTLPPPEKPFSEDQFMRLLTVGVPDKWPVWFSELSKE